MDTENTKIHAYKTFSVDNYTTDPLGTLKRILAAARTPVMVVYHTTEECQAILKTVRNACYYDGTKLMLNRWNERKLPVMLVHPLRASFADFSKGGHVIVWFSAPTDLAEYAQVNARLCRASQTHDVTVHNLMDVSKPVNGWVRLLEQQESMASAPTNVRTDHYVTDPLEELRHIVNATDDPVLVVYHTTEERDAVLKAIKNSCCYDGTDRMITRWNEQKLPVMLIGPLETKNFGPNRCGHTIAWFSAPSDKAEYDQVNACLRHVGPGENTDIHRIIDMNAPIDEWENDA